MSAPANTPTSAARACPWKLFGVLRGSLLFLFAFVVSLFPVCLDCDLADTPYPVTPSIAVKAHWSQCFADAPDPGTYPEADLSFIEYLANSAGIGNQGDLVTSSIGIVAVTTGINMAKTTGAQIGAQLSTSLDSLADAADYPSFSELSAEQQASWGSADNYNAAKYNSFLNAFGLGDAAQRYKEGFTGSGGGSDFDFTQQEKDKVDRLGRIANRWISGIGNTVGDLLDFFNDKEAVEQWLPAAVGGDIFDASDIQDWPSGVPTTLYTATGSDGYARYKYGNNGQYTGTFRVQTNSNVILVFFAVPADYGHSNIGIFGFSKTSFGIRNGTTGNFSNCSTATVNNEVVYYSGFSQGSHITEFLEYNLPLNATTGIPGNNDLKKIGYYILYGDIASGGSTAEEVEDYPEEPNRNQNTWIPAIGIVPNISWPQLTTPNIPSSPETPFNPNNQTDTPNWGNDAATNVLHLSDIKFDKLFPFCLLFDITLLFNKVQSSISSDGLSWNVLDVPFDYDGNDDEMTLDLTWLYNLALMVRPFFQILLGAALLFLTIWFWRNVLTG